MMTPNEALKRSVEIAGSQEKLGRLIHFSQAAISRMVQSGMATAKAAMRIESALRGQVTARQLRPQDFFDDPPPPDQENEKQRAPH